MEYTTQHINALPAGIASDADLSVWVPSEQLVVHTLEKPSAPKRKWLELLPWMLEERLLEPVENIHIVLLGENSNNTIAVLIVSREAMQSWIKQLEDQEFQFSALQPDYLALPWQAGQISIAWRKSDETAPILLVRTGQFTGFAAQEKLAVLMLQQHLNTAEPNRLLAYMKQEDIPLAVAEQAELKPELKPELNWHINMTSSVNLLQGEFQLQKQSKGSLGWLATAALVLLTTCLGAGWLKLDNSILEDEIVLLGQAQSRAFNIYFPGITRPRDIEASVEKLIDDRFFQREQLQAPLQKLLTDIDADISVCACELKSLTINNEGEGELIFVEQENSTLAQLNFNGYVSSVTNDPSKQQIVVAISRDNL